MTYQELVDGTRRIYENADAREIMEHVAIQVEITGEVTGIFYIEIAQRHICVEPYDYRDHDVVVYVDSKILEQIILGELSTFDAVKGQKLEMHGNMEKISLLGKIVYPDEKKKIASLDKRKRFLNFKTVVHAYYQ